MLLPTTPFRTKKFVKLALSLLDEDTDSVVSLGPHIIFHLKWLFSVESKTTPNNSMLSDSPLMNGNTKSGIKNLFRTKMDLYIF